MKKILKRLSKIQWVLIIVAVLAAGYYLFNGALPFQKVDVTMKEQKAKSGETVIQIEDADLSQIAVEFPMDMSETAIQDAIHKMSHQKVIANKKWGAIPLTKERVERLLEIVNTHPAKYENATLYIAILNRWDKGEFSRVDNDHNAIWNLQGGTIGKATGVLSLDEEKAYIEKNFHIKVKQ
ncbi:hypothetical protein BGM25_01025 [Bacillus sp. FJAT-29953]|nr:hypothetical protein [Bacillus sp. FJAT-29953]